MYGRLVIHFCLLILSMRSTLKRDCLWLWSVARSLPAALNSVNSRELWHDLEQQIHDGYIILVAKVTLHKQGGAPSRTQSYKARQSKSVVASTNCQNCSRTGGLALKIVRIQVAPCPANNNPARWFGLYCILGQT